MGGRSGASLLVTPGGMLGVLTPHVKEAPHGRRLRRSAGCGYRSAPAPVGDRADDRSRREPRRGPRSDIRLVLGGRRAAGRWRHGAFGASVGRQGFHVSAGQKRRPRRGGSGRPAADGSAAAGLRRPAGGTRATGAGPASGQAGLLAQRPEGQRACGTGQAGPAHQGVGSVRPRRSGTPRDHAAGRAVPGPHRRLLPADRWAAVEAAQKIPASAGWLTSTRARIADRRGRNIATVAVARKLLTLVYYGLRDGHIRALHPAKVAA